MKKIFMLLLSLVTVFSVTGCSQNSNYDISIKASEFSEETLNVLELIDDELQIFDIKVDETVKSYSMSVWGYRDGQWHEDGNTYGNIEMLGGQVAIKLSETDCELFYINDNGHSSYSYPIETDFESSTSSGGSRIDEEIQIEINKETPIWVKTGTEESTFKVMNISEDFRNSECNAGVAVTLTFSDEVVE